MYMPDGSEAMADVVVVTKDGTRLMAHASQLLVNCKALAAVPELFENATKSHPVELTEPFSSHESSVVVDFLTCIYARCGRVLNAACRLDVIKLAHTLDASFLDAVRDVMPDMLHTCSVDAVNDIIDAATLCGWGDVRNAGISQLIWLLEKPLDLVQPQRTLVLEPHYGDHEPVENASYSVETMATRPFEFSTDLLATHVHLDSLAVARKVVDVCSPETLAIVVQAFASAKRLDTLHHSGNEHVAYHPFVTRNVQDFVTCIDRDQPSRLVRDEVGVKYADYFESHPGCSIEGDAASIEATLVTVFEIESLEEEKSSMHFHLGSLDVHIRGTSSEERMASFTLHGTTTDSKRVEVSYTIAVPRSGDSHTGRCIFGKDDANGEGVEADVSYGGPNVPVVCTIHSIREM